MNTERFVIQNIEGTKVYVNRHVKFIGTEPQARLYAASNNYGGGVEILPQSLPKEKLMDWDPKKKLEFKCPQCGKGILGQVQNVVTTYPVSSIPVCGNVEIVYDEPDMGDTGVIGHECRACAFELRDEYGNPIVDTVDVTIWIVENSNR